MIMELFHPVSAHLLEGEGSVAKCAADFQTRTAHALASFEADLLRETTKRWQSYSDATVFT